MAFGNDQDMDRGLRVDILKRHHVLILVYHSGRDIPGDDLAKQTIAHHSFLIKVPGGH